jgi:hypothetical protein
MRIVFSDFNESTPHCGAAGCFRMLSAFTSGLGLVREGHEVVAIIAADDLAPTARSHVAEIVSVPADTHSVEKAMAAASIRRDTEFREQDRSTASWHYIDICLQDTEQDISARCPQGNCVTAKIDEYARRLRDGNYNKWGAAGDLASLLHFVGDIHSAAPYHDQR